MLGFIPRASAQHTNIHCKINGIDVRLLENTVAGVINVKHHAADLVQP